MKNFISALIIIAGVVFGIYVGFWEMFVGGIIGLIDTLKETDISGYTVAINISKIVFAGFVGWVIFYVSLVIAALVGEKKKSKFGVKKFK